jgi:hypothetical protein
LLATSLVEFDGAHPGAIAFDADHSFDSFLSVEPQKMHAALVAVTTKVSHLDERSELVADYPAEAARL